MPRTPRTLRIPAYLAIGKRFFDRHNAGYCTITNHTNHIFDNGRHMVGIQFDKRRFEEMETRRYPKSSFEARAMRFSPVDWLDNPIRRAR